MSDIDRENWEIPLAARLEQQGIADPGKVVAQWKRHRRKAIMRTLTELKTQLATLQQDTAPTTKINPSSGLDAARGEELHLQLNSICDRIADAESSLQTATRKAADRLERRQGESEKVLAVLKDRLPATGQSEVQQRTARGLGTAIFFGVALAAVVVSLVLALSLMLGLVGA